MPRTSKVCKFCSLGFTPTHSRVKYCSQNCVNKARLPKSKKTRQILSERMKKYYETHEPMHGDVLSRLAGQATKGKYNPNPKSLCELSSRTISKIFKRLNLGCSLCGWNEATCDLHHIQGRKIENPDSHDNLTYICPNCHRKAHQKKLTSVLISLTDFIGDEWKKVYYG